jgi:hypothetical protein
MSIGDIQFSRFWISVERRYFAWWRWYIGFGPTYNGTTAGLCIALPFAVIVGHYREPKTA